MNDPGAFSKQGYYEAKWKKEERWKVFWVPTGEKTYKNKILSVQLNGIPTLC